MTKRKPKHLHKPDGRPLEYTEERVNELCESLIAFAMNEDNLTLTMWQMESGCYRQRQSELVEKYPQFRDAKRFAMEIVGDRRERAAGEGTLPTSTVNKSMGVYSPEVKDYEGWLRQKQGEATGNILVNSRGSMSAKKENDDDS